MNRYDVVPGVSRNILCDAACSDVSREVVRSVPKNAQNNPKDKDTDTPNQRFYIYLIMYDVPVGKTGTKVDAIRHYTEQIFDSNMINEYTVYTCGDLWYFYMCYLSPTIYIYIYTSSMLRQAIATPLDPHDQEIIVSYGSVLGGG